MGEPNSLDLVEIFREYAVMPLLELRLQAGTKSAGDLLVTVQDKTFEYLSTSTASEIRVSAYLDRAWPIVEKQYAELYLNETLSFPIHGLTPGSKTRKLALPCEMLEGEQLVILVSKLQAI